MHEDSNLQFTLVTVTFTKCYIQHDSDINFTWSQT